MSEGQGEEKMSKKKTLLLSLKEVEDLVEEERLVLYRHSVVNAPLLIIIMEGKRWASLRRGHDYHYII